MKGKSSSQGLMFSRCVALALLSISLGSGASTHGQDQGPDWQTEVRKLAEAQDWDSAMHIVEHQIALAPQDMDVRAWRARLLAWSGHLPEAENEYLEILKVSRRDPDHWIGLATVYLREGKTQEARQAIAAAEDLDPRRTDVHIIRARILRAAGERVQAQSEFQMALDIDPANAEAKNGLVSLHGEPKHELRLTQDNDLLSYDDAYRNEGITIASQWTSQWKTIASGSFYQRGGVQAEKFTASITRRQPKWGALTIGGAAGHDNSIIPRNEVFFDLSHGWKTDETTFVRSVELTYGQHWYWYQSARILTLYGSALLYLPDDWTFSLTSTGARSSFSGVAMEWRPSGIARLTFPLVRRGDRKLAGNVYFATGTESFAVADQIGRFASQTYGGGLRFQLSARQDVTGYAGYQKRTQDRSDTSFGLSYGLHF
jgi:hypothetical protein